LCETSVCVIILAAQFDRQQSSSMPVLMVHVVLLFRTLVKDL